MSHQDTYSRVFDNKTRCFHVMSGHFLVMFVANKLDIFDEKSGQFPAASMATKTDVLTRCQDIFWRCLWRQNQVVSDETSGLFQMCFW